MIRLLNVFDDLVVFRRFLLAPMIEAKREIVKKHTGVIHCRSTSSPLSLVARKLFNVLLIMIFPEVHKPGTHSVPLRDVLKGIGFSSHNRDEIKKALRELRQYEFEWDILRNSGEEDWRNCSILAEVGIVNGDCVFEFSSTMREKLSEPRVFGLVDIAAQREMSSRYVVSLSENLSPYLDETRTPVFSLDEIKALLEVPQSSLYLKFKYLNNQVLKPAVDGLNSNTKLSYSVSMHKHPEGKRIVEGVWFEFLPKETNAYELND